MGFMGLGMPCWKVSGLGDDRPWPERSVSAQPPHIFSEAGHSLVAQKPYYAKGTIFWGWLLDKGTLNPDKRDKGTTEPPRFWCFGCQYMAAATSPQKRFSGGELESSPGWTETPFVAAQWQFFACRSMRVRDDVGMFPLFLTVLNRDYNRGYTTIPIKDC